MLSQTREKGKHIPNTRARMPFGIKRLAIAGICLSIITAGTAVAHAAGVLKPVSEVFREIFHLEKETDKITNGVGSSLNISDTSGDVSITADAVLGDSYNFAVVFSIQKKDGTAFKKADILQTLANEQNNLIGFRSMNLRIDKELDSNQRGNFLFYDANPDDSSFQLLYTCTIDTDECIGAPFTATFTDFGYRDSSTNFFPVAEGNWRITFPLDYTDSSRHFDTNQKIKLDGKNIAVKKASISPVGFHIDFEIENLESEKDADEVDNILEHIPMRLLLTDGRKINLNKKGNGFTIMEDGGDSADVSYGNTFREIIPIEQMKSLCIGDITLDF